MPQGLGKEISTITGKPQPSFDEKIEGSKKVMGLAQAVTGINPSQARYNWMPWAGPQDAVYESILRPAALKKIAFNKRAVLRSAGEVDKIYSHLKDRLPPGYDARIQKLNPTDQAQAKKRVARAVLREPAWTHAKGIQRTPQVMLDTVDDIKFWKPSEIIDENVSTLGQYGNKRMKLNPLAADETVIPHEATHGLQAHWSHPNRMVGFDSAGRNYQQQVYDARMIHGPLYEQVNKLSGEGAKKWYKKNYKDIPSEVNARAFADEIVSVGEHSKPGYTDKEAMDAWRRSIHKQAKTMATDVPEMYKLAKTHTGHMKSRMRDIPQYAEPQAPKLSRSTLFRNKEEARAWAAHATPKDRVKLNAMIKGSKAKQAKLKAKKDIQGWYDETVQASLMRDANTFLTEAGK